MLIGVDCKKLLEPTRTGTHNYLFNLLKNSAVVDQDNEYLLYFAQHPTREFFESLSKGNPKWHYKLVSSSCSWTQCALAKATYIDRLDMLVCTWHTLPIIHRAGTKLLSVIHDFSPKGRKSLPVYWTLLLSDVVIAVSEATKSEIIRRAPWAGKKVGVVYEAVDLTAYVKSSVRAIEEVKSKYNILAKYFLSVGTLNARKNVRRMLAAFDLMVASTGNGTIEYVLVGSCAKDYEGIYEYARGLKSAGQIKFLGRLSNTDIVRLYSGAEALVYTSLEEGFGLPILEAFSCKCPVITSMVSSMQEVADDAALLVEPTDIEAITTGMFKLLSMTEIAKMSLVSKGYERCKLYSWELCASNVLKLFQKSL